MFLDEITPFPKKVWNEKARVYSNWVKVAAVIYSIEDRRIVLRVLQLELLTQRRPMVIKRVYSRFSALRAQEEKRDLVAFFSDVPAATWTTDYVNWHTLSKTLGNATLSDLKSIMRCEYETSRRAYILKRLYGRFHMIRMTKERKQMVEWRMENVGRKRH